MKTLVALLTLAVIATATPAIFPADIETFKENGVLSSQDTTVRRIKKATYIPREEVLFNNINLEKDSKNIHLPEARHVGLKNPIPKFGNHNEERAADRVEESDSDKLTKDTNVLMNKKEENSSDLTVKSEDHLNQKQEMREASFKITEENGFQIEKQKLLDMDHLGMDNAMHASMRMDVRDDSGKSLAFNGNQWNNQAQLRSSYGSPSSSYGSPSSPAADSPSGAVGIFPNAKIGGCAIPLLVSCSPSLVSGSLAKTSHPQPHPSYTVPSYRSADDMVYYMKRDTTIDEVPILKFQQPLKPYTHKIVFDKNRY